MVFDVSALNRVYNFKLVRPGSVLDRVWLQDCPLVHLAIRNQRRKSVFILVNNASCQLSFHLKGKYHEVFDLFLFKKVE